MLRFAAAFGLAAVSIGAFGAHGLKPYLDAYQLSIFEKGVFYQFVHALALLATAMLAFHFPENKRLSVAAGFFIAGIFCFSGSLYLLAVRHLLSVGVNWVGPITPIGGLCFMAGWAILGLSAVPKRQ